MVKKPNIMVHGFFKQETMQMHGPCRVIVDNTTIIEGHYQNDKLNGLVRIIYFDGMTYLGYCKNGYKDGHGELIRANGEHIKGIWSNGKLIQNLNPEA